MSEAKVVKKNSPEHEALQLEQFRDQLKTEVSDVKRRIHGLLGGLKPIEERLRKIDKLIAALD